MRKFVPDEKFVVVPSRRELTVLAVPAETAYFLFMTGQPFAVLVWGADVAMIDESVAGTGGEDVFVPG